MDQLRILRSFVQVAELASFTAAARTLGVTQSQVSRAIRQLERGIGSQLVLRTTRRVSITPEGQRYLRGVRAALRMLDEAGDAVRQDGHAVRGTLRVTAPIEFGEYLAPVIAELVATHVALAIDAVLTDRIVDLIDEGFDVAIRTGPLVPSALRTRRLGTADAVLCASPAYTERRGVPRRPEDLAAHDCVVFTAKRTPEWLALSDRRGRTTRVRIAGRLRVNELRAVRRAALAGAGIAALPLVMIRRALADRELVRVLPGWSPPAAAIHAVFPARLPQPARLTAFLDTMARSMRDAVRPT
jgi:DNA-binding transcriptional LysR family regulator